MSYELTGLQDRVAVVTGAGRMRSIGRPIAVALARAGCDVVITGTGRAPADYPEDEQEAGWRDIDSVADEIRGEGRSALPVVSDVADPDAVQSLLAQIVDELGPVHIVVNNAGAAKGADRVPIVDLELAAWNTVMNVNLTGTFLMSKYFARHMIEHSEGGSFVNICSVSPRILAPNSAAYATSKAAVETLTAFLAQELGRHGITANAINPGLIDTLRHDDWGRGEEWTDYIDSRIAMERAGTGEDVAHQVVYLCSDQGRWITGQSYTIDGGMAPAS